MDGFLFAQPGNVLHTAGTRQVFDDRAAARAALRSGSADLVVGALPFDPREPAALAVPAQAGWTAGWQPSAAEDLPEICVIDEIPSPAEHVARLTKLVELLSDPGQQLRKVVAARSVIAQARSALEPLALAGRLRLRHPRATVFAADLSPAGRPGATLVGATPEILVTRRGPLVAARPLAGTAPRPADPDAAARNAQALLHSGKDRAEHAFVVDWLRERLGLVCQELSVADEPELVEASNVWHLATPIHGRLSDPGITALELALLLHPTPAVCGTPTDSALDLIVNDEPPRGFYGGAVGWCDATGDGEWAVAIRCAELSSDGQSIQAFGGGGIIADSDPVAELAETTAKLHTLLGALGCAHPGDRRAPHLSTD